MHIISKRPIVNFSQNLMIFLKLVCIACTAGCSILGEYKNSRPVRTTEKMKANEQNRIVHENFYRLL